METLNERQIRELRAHQPIPHGGWKLVGGIIAMLLILAMTGIAFYRGLRLFQQGDRSAVIFVLIAVGGCAIAVVFGCHEETRRRLRAYWCRNVRGYVARFSLAPSMGADGTPHPTLAYCIVMRREDADLRCLTPREPGKKTIAISLPLGGWFAKPWILTTNDRDQAALRGWSVRLHAIFGTGTVMVEIRKRNHATGADEHIVTDVGSALRMFEEIATKPGALPSISNYVRGKNVELGVSGRERAELDRRMTTLFNALRKANRNPPFDPNLPIMDRIGDEAHHLIDDAYRYTEELLPAAVKGRKAAIGYVQEIAATFEGSSRLRETIEGLQLYIAILTWLIQCDVYLDVMEATDQARYAIARMEARTRLAEKQKRDRRRHGKRADAPATT